MIDKQQNEDKQKYIATKKSKSNKTKQIKKLCNKLKRFGAERWSGLYAIFAEDDRDKG